MSLLSDIRGYKMEEHHRLSRNSTKYYQADLDRKQSIEREQIPRILKWGPRWTFWDRGICRCFYPFCVVFGKKEDIFFTYSRGGARVVVVSSYLLHSQSQESCRSEESTRFCDRSSGIFILKRSFARESHIRITSGRIIAVRDDRWEEQAQIVL